MVRTALVLPLAWLALLYVFARILFPALYLFHNLDQFSGVSIPVPIWLTRIVPMRVLVVGWLVSGPLLVGLVLVGVWYAVRCKH